jgi:hypothetical protein
MNKFIAIFSLFIGEALAIYPELLITRGASWAWTFFIITLAGIPLLIGYRLGSQCFTTVWPVFVVSLTSIVIVEPLLLLFWLKQVPSWGSVAGLILGVIGMFLAIKY